MDTGQYQFYKNAQYTNTRNKKKTLIVDINDTDGSTHLGSGGEFSVDLFEPLIIDKHSEVYLDNVITFNSNITDSIDNSAFCLRINEFNIDSNAASGVSTNRGAMYNSILIPNEHDSFSDNHQSVLHKSKKFNYVCDINPCKLTKITGKVTNLLGEPIFHGEKPEHNFTYSLINIDIGAISASGTIVPNLGGANDNLIAGDFDFISCSGTSLDRSQGRFSTIHPKNTSVLHFHTIGDISASFSGSFTGGEGDIFFDAVDGSGTGNGFKITNTVSTDNQHMRLIQNPGRFIAEFIIISKE